MTFFKKKRKDPEGQPLDKFGISITQVDPPVDHQLLLREEIDFNTEGKVVEIRKVFDDEAGGEDIFKKELIPDGGNVTPVKTDIIKAWVKVV